MSLGRIVTATVGLAVTVFLALPLVYAVWVSFSPDSFLTPPVERWSLRWYAAFLTDRRWTAALVRGLAIGLVAALIAVAAGVPLAFAIARHRFRGRRAIAAAVLLPLSVPAAVLGMGLLPVMHATGLWGQPLGTALVHGLLGLPVIYLIARRHLDGVNPHLEAAARGLGATPWQTARRITLPLLRPAVTTGAAAAFALSLNEAMVSLFLATPTTETLPALAWAQLRYSPSPLVAVASCVSVAVGATVALAVTHRWTRRNGVERTAPSTVAGSPCESIRETL